MPFFWKIQNFIKSERSHGFFFSNLIPFFLNVLEHWSHYKELFSSIVISIDIYSNDIFRKFQNVIKSQSAHQLRQKLYWKKGHFDFTSIPNFNSISWVIFEKQTFEFFEVLTHTYTQRHTQRHTRAHARTCTHQNIF